MGLLVGLPLKLFHILFLALRFLWPVVLFFVIRWALRRLRNAQFEPKKQAPKQEAKEPEFKGPVYTVDYEEVPEDRE